MEWPEAIVVGGYPADRAEIVSRMMGSGWKVREHRLAGQTGDDYQRLPKGVKLVVVLRDTLDEKQYNRAHTMADIGKAPVVKWDVDRHKFRNRLEKLGLLYEPPKFQEPEPPKLYAPEAINGVPALPKELGIVLDKPKSPIDDLRALCELVKAELETNPLFSGVTVQVNDDFTATVTPVARSFRIGEARNEAPVEQKGVVLTKPPSATPPAEPPRPVLQPITPVFQPAPPKIEIKPKLNKRGRKMPPPMDMRCRYPNCTAQSRGPRYQFHCAAHSDIPMRDKKVNMAAYKKERHATN